MTSFLCRIDNNYPFIYLSPALLPETNLLFLTKQHFQSFLNHAQLSLLAQAHLSLFIEELRFADKHYLNITFPFFFFSFYSNPCLNGHLY